MTHELNMASYKTAKGASMFGIEKLPEGKILLNEYTDNGIIKHEFDSMLGMEIWVMKYRGYDLS